jgi:hypothetical protein
MGSAQGAQAARGAGRADRQTRSADRQRVRTEGGMGGRS